MVQQALSVPGVQAAHLEPRVRRGHPGRRAIQVNLVRLARKVTLARKARLAVDVITRRAEGSDNSTDTKS